MTEGLRSLKPKLQALKCQLHAIHGSINIWVIEMVMAKWVSKQTVFKAI